MAKKDFNQLALDQAKEFGGKLSVVSKSRLRRGMISVLLIHRELVRFPRQLQRQVFSL